MNTFMKKTLKVIGFTLALVMAVAIMPLSASAQTQFEQNEAFEAPMPRTATPICVTNIPAGGILNLRSGPGTQFTILGRFGLNDLISGVNPGSNTPGWTRVSGRTQDGVQRQGYVNNNYIRMADGSLGSGFRCDP